MGLGLMGGSLARGLKAGPHPPRVTALSLEPEELEAALASNIIDEGFSRPEGFFRPLDLVVYCTPLLATITLLAEHRDFLNDEALLTDVVSLKVPVMEQARNLGLETRFVGSHPMAGGEGTGFSSSRDGLYEGSRVWLVGEGAPPDRVTRIEDFWQALGGKTRGISAEDHDALMAWVSHLPQLTSSALALTLQRAGYEREVLGPGGRDMTRLAGSNPEMWSDLLKFAPADLPEALRAVEETLSKLRLQLVAGEGEKIAEELERTRIWSTEEEWS